MIITKNDVRSINIALQDIYKKLLALEGEIEELKKEIKKLK